jgi:hypothetical protein
VRAVAAIAVTLLLLAGCGSAGGDPAATEPPSPTPRESPTGQVSGSVTGTLGGDAGLEGGCAWLDTPQGRIQVIYPDGYDVAFDPLRLSGPDGVVAEEGDTVTVRGELGEGLVSTCQVGPMFTATEVVDG